MLLFIIPLYYVKSQDYQINTSFIKKIFYKKIYQLLLLIPFLEISWSYRSINITPRLRKIC